MSRKCVIFDVDGTIANTDHRNHYLKTHPRRWDDYKADALFDEPYQDIVWLLKTLRRAGCDIVLCTARTEDERSITEKWLASVARILHIEDYDKMYMRETEDRRDDSVVKLELLEQIRNDGYDPVMVFDDRQRVVDAWRESGMRCLQVQPGDF